MLFIMWHIHCPNQLIRQSRQACTNTVVTDYAPSLEEDACLWK